MANVVLSCLHVGLSAYRRGDVIRVTVMFEDERERDGNVQVPVVFTVNGRGIIPPEDQTYIDYSPDRPFYPCVYFRSRSEGKSSVLAKVKITKLTIMLIFKIKVIEVSPFLNDWRVQ